MKRLLLAAALVGLTAYSVHGATNVDAAFRAFWDAQTPSAADKTVRAIVESGVDFDAAWARLKAGRSYAKEKTGLIRLPVSVGGESFETII